MRGLAWLVPIVLLVSGCISVVAEPDDGLGWHVTAIEASARVAALTSALPCAVDTVDTTTSTNLATLDHIAYPFTGWHGEIDMAGDWMVVARYDDGGFEVVNVADPENMVHATKYTTTNPNKSAYDVKWMPDGRTVVIGHGRNVGLVNMAPVLDSPYAPSEMEARGIKPLLISSWAYPATGITVGTNMHMLATHRIGGTDYVFVAPNDNTGVWIAKLGIVNGKPGLITVGQVGAPLNGGPLGPHDMSVFDDELLGKPVLYIANGFEGWQAWDVSTPSAPVRLALMPNLDPAQQYTHTVVSEIINGKRIVVTMAEVGVNAMKVFDATNFQAPILLGEWIADPKRPHAPEHNLQLLDGILYMAHYDQGFFVFDLNTLIGLPLVDTATLSPIAHYAVPHRETPDSLGFANLWDINVHRGVIYVSELNYGTSSIAFGCLTPGDESQTSRS